MWRHCRALLQDGKISSSWMKSYTKKCLLMNHHQTCVNFFQTWHRHNAKMRIAQGTCTSKAPFHHERARSQESKYCIRPSCWLGKVGALNKPARRSSQATAFKMGNVYFTFIWRARVYSTKSGYKHFDLDDLYHSDKAGLMELIYCL